MGPDSTIERNISFVDDRLEVIADEIDVLGSGVMGLTFKCARCHSQGKYDPDSVTARLLPIESHLQRRIRRTRLA